MGREKKREKEVISWFTVNGLSGITAELLVKWNSRSSRDVVLNKVEQLASLTMARRLFRNY